MRPVIIKLPSIFSSPYKALIVSDPFLFKSSIYVLVLLVLLLYTFLAEDKNTYSL